jgi:chaperonin GroEL
MERRVSQLRGGVAVLKVGTYGDYEREYIKLKAEDTVKAVKAALEEGIVEGGGMTLWRIADELKSNTVGEEILKKALKAPLRKIIENAGKDYADIVRGLPDGMGYDAKLDTYTNMIKSGIIDPTKVERCAVENSVSSASTFITSFATISDAEIKKD